ncbi:peptidoglycan/LPS O-acetylase OafA/YrhL [Mucilaginibacter frigoritolerans]|uniref:Peptidoglycan/LPS O-acetylase OafA/YrhL n=1 Tax=Mucilaginibacter frigoritolerans TaxID=652788 RepID=A0A562U4P3_9SPHI|nr:acyltransferase [Mucilaginibacter frigoritolerans]TWJ00792.1 peptidoglycan/LPS O-acetylase OafA/YrhL [Mucilaginibacter frigoritolerans]
MTYIRLSRSNFIHLLRWGSALLVVFNHLRSILFKDYPLLKHANAFTKFFYLLTSLGHQAVVIFFVLSGYLVGGSVISEIRKGKFDIKLYALKRISRLYAVLLFALVLTIVLDHTGIYFDQVGLYTDKIKTATLGFSIANRLSFKYFVTSLCMMQTIILPPIGSNSPLWSLAYEFWYYVAFPCCSLLLIFIKSKNKYAFLCAILLILMFTFLPQSIKLSFFIWLIGLIPFYITLKKPYKFISLIALPIWLALKKVVHIDDFLYDFILALIVAFGISSFENYNQPAKGFFLKANEKLSSFSYSTYLIHFPIIMLILTIIRNYYFIGIWNAPSLIGYLIFISVLVFIFICSYIVAIFTEYKTPKFRLFLEKLFLR